MTLNSNWIKASLIRAVKTFSQTALSMLTIGQAVIDVNWINVLSVSFVASIISILTSITGLPEVKQSELLENIENMGERDENY